MERGGVVELRDLAWTGFDDISESSDRAIRCSIVRRCTLSCHDCTTGFAFVVQRLGGTGHARIKRRVQTCVANRDSLPLELRLSDSLLGALAGLDACTRLFVRRVTFLRQQSEHLLILLHLVVLDKLHGLSIEICQRHCLLEFVMGLKGHAEAGPTVFHGGGTVGPLGLEDARPAGT